ncbi:putative DNA-binding protein [Bhargavaea cecembensis DSE10]|uniref:Putative DNA-binding protein n=1 Tax=Bhargavaea cecembensis DSE10 TaxID=1235279 RepID=M7P8M8_9BACL|nr:PPC domain-containing DNA-binding protein [Bhargavaea cecembensis]EMR06859.1 putative DNA-binding protein [Bhargavaea cecembensis DSE10]
MDNHLFQAFYDEQTNRVIGRFKKDCDLFGGFKEVCREMDIKAGHFQCIGSLTQAAFYQVVKDDAVPAGIRYSERRISDSPVELLSASGFVGSDETGKTDVHMHGVFVDCDGKVNGGHFLDGENPVAITVEFVLFPISEVELTRRKDEVYGVPIFQFSKGGA